jgi:hypothetical protein
MRWLPAVVLALFCFGNSVAAQTTRSPVARCSPTTPSTDQAEAECLPLLKGLAERNGNELRLRLRDGSHKSYESVTSGCEPPEKFDRAKCYHFRLVAFHPDPRAFVVDLSFDEGGRVMIVSGRTGQELELSSRPHYSPSGKWLVSVNSSEVGDHAYDIAVLSSKTDPAKIEWKYSSPEGDYELWSFVGWDGDDRIKLRAEVRKGSGPVTEHMTTATFTSKGWVLRRPWATR